MRINLFKYGVNHPIELRKGQYYDNGNLAIRLITYENGYPEVWSDLTVNLNKIDSDCAYIDINNNGEGILKWIEENNLGVFTREIESSGYCTYPKYKFNSDVLKNMEEI